MSDRQTDGRTNEPTDKQTPTNGLADGATAKRTDEQADEEMGGRTDRVPYRNA